MHKSVGLNQRRVLIQAAVEMIAKHGVEEVTFEDLARSQGLKRANVAYYFKSRSDLLEALLIEILTDAVAFIEAQIDEKLKMPSRSWDHELNAYCFAQEAWVKKKHSSAVCLLLLYHLGSANPRFAEILRKSREGGQTRLLHLLSKHPKFSKMPVGQLMSLCRPLHEAVTGHLLYLIAFGKEDPKAPSLREKLDLLLP